MKFSEFSLLLFFTFIPCILGVMPGGISEIPVDDPEVVRLSQVALTKLNEGKRGDGASNLVEIVKASRQIVSGTLTRLTLRVSEGEKKRLCEVKIWEQPWLDKTEVTFEDCSEEGEASGSKSKRGAEDVSNTVDRDLLLFNDFIRKHKKVYSDEKEFKKRFHIFRVNLNRIKLLRKSELGTAQYGPTWFSDLSDKEFERHLGLKVPQTVDDLPPADIPDIKLPDEFDWRHYNVVTSVKNQKFCGSCWAFSVTGNVEGQWALKKKELISLSEQELIDCDTGDGGCFGGFMINAYKAIITLGGLETEKDYPYEAKNDKCHFNRSEAQVQISGAVNIVGDEIKMAKWLVKNGPMSVAVNAKFLLHYHKGIIHFSKHICNPNSLNHGVLIVGFGVQSSKNKTTPFWIVKNSWGKSWGEEGYFRIYRGDGTCGINKAVTSAIVD